MAYGLRVKNDGLGLQIDSLYNNYALYEHGESVTTSLSGGIYQATVTFSTPTSRPPLIALKPGSSQHCGIYKYTKSGSNYTGFVVYSDGAAATFDWQAFAPRQDSSGEDYGLRVYDDSGDLVFDSGYNQMKIIDVDTSSIGWNNENEDISHPSDSNAYFIVAPWGRIDYYFGFVPPIPGQVLKIISMLKYINATTVNFASRPFVGGAAAANGAFGYWPGTWTIITVEKAF